MFNELEGSDMAPNAAVYTPLNHETRAALPTPEAAFHLNRAPQTLRQWACQETGPIRPERVHGRLSWPVSEIKRVLGLTCEA